MKIGNKGFMLAETLIVSVVVATVLVTMFTGVSNVSSAYETRNRYYDVDSLYAAIEVNEILRRKNLLEGIGTKELTNDISEFKNFYLFSNGDKIYVYIMSYDSTNTDVDALKSSVNSSMNTLKSKNSNVTFSDYLDYLSGNMDFTNDDYNYLIIVERRENNDIDDCYYYALKLKY